MLHVVVLGLLAVGSPLLAAVIQPQHSLQDVFQQSEESEYFQFKNKIERVAVIGAGVSGLVGTGVFQDHNLTVRTFERAPKPGESFLSSPTSTFDQVLNWYFCYVQEGTGTTRKRFPRRQTTTPRSRPPRPTTSPYFLPASLRPISCEAPRRSKKSGADTGFPGPCTSMSSHSFASIESTAQALLLLADCTITTRS